MPDAARVLIVEDDFLIAASLQMTLEDLGYEVCGVVDTARKAIEAAHRGRPDIVLMDVRLRGADDGVDAALAIHGEYAPHIVFITGSNEPETRARIYQDHPSALLIKPILPEQLENTLRELLLRPA